MSDLGNRKIFAENLQRFMKKNKKSRNDISKALKVPYTTVSDWVNGNAYPRIDKIEKLSGFFNVNKSSLIESYSDNIGFEAKSMLPVIGIIKAGTPLLAEENIIDWVPSLVPKNLANEYFYLKVLGDSMIKAGINEGCLVEIKKQSSADDGQIVACRVNGDEATLKRLKIIGKNVFLIPENPNYQPIVLNCKDFENGEAEIIGVAKRVISYLK